MSRDGYEISNDDARLDRALIHRFLHDDSYWARGIPREIMDRAIDNSLCFGLYAGDGRQVGFARAITDRAAIAYLADVFVLEQHRGRGRAVRIPPAGGPRAVDGDRRPLPDGINHLDWRAHAGPYP